MILQVFATGLAATIPVVVGFFLSKKLGKTSAQVGEIKVMVDGRLDEALSEIRALRDQRTRRDVTRAQDIAAERPPSPRDEDGGGGAAG